MTLAVVFDLDDTLYPEESFNLSGYRAVGRHVETRCGVSGFGSKCAELHTLGVRGDLFERVLKLTGLTLPVAELVEVYRNHQPELAPFEDALAVLRLLQGKHPLGLLTDGFGAVQRRKVFALGLEGFFSAIVYSDDEGRKAWKPSPLPYQRMMRCLAGLADRFVYIGDNARKDFVTARSLGWHTVMIERPGNVHPRHDIPLDLRADMKVESLLQIRWKDFS